MSVAYPRVNPVDHMVAGFTVGSLHRLSSGWRPALAAGIMGSGSGLLIGFTFWVAHLLRGMKHQVSHTFYCRRTIVIEFVDKFLQPSSKRNTFNPFLTNLTWLLTDVKRKQTQEQTHFFADFLLFTQLNH